MPILPARLQQDIIQESGEFSIYPMSEQIIPSVEHCCLQDELLGPHNWKAQGCIYSGESSCSIPYQPTNAGNYLYAK